MKEMLQDYKESFGLFFTNVPAVMIIIGCFFRLWQA